MSHYSPSFCPVLQAAAAGAEGRECLFDLLQAAQELVQQGLAGAKAERKDAQPGAGASLRSGAADEDALRLVLLKLDHMRDRRGYCK